MTYLEEIVKLAQEKLAADKEARLMERVMMLDPYYDAEKEAKKMFPRIKCVRCMEDEIWYWNNGEPEGYRIITFRMQPMSQESGKYGFNFTYF